MKEQRCKSVHKSTQFYTKVHNFTQKYTSIVCYIQTVQKVILTHLMSLVSSKYLQKTVCPGKLGKQFFV